MITLVASYCTYVRMYIRTYVATCVPLIEQCRGLISSYVHTYVCNKDGRMKYLEVVNNLIMGNAL